MGVQSVNVGAVKVVREKVKQETPDLKSLLETYSIAPSQVPIGTDTPLQIEFGAEQILPEFTLSADGSVTIHQAGHYFFTLRVNFGRETSTGEAMCFFVALRNGVSVGTIPIKIVNQATIIPIEQNVSLRLEPSDVLTFEIFRDSGSADDGGLYMISPTAVVDRQPSPTAFMEVSKHSFYVPTKKVIVSGEIIGNEEPVAP